MEIRLPADKLTKFCRCGCPRKKSQRGRFYSSKALFTVPQKQSGQAKLLLPECILQQQSCKKCTLLPDQTSHFIPICCGGTPFIKLGTVSASLNIQPFHIQILHLLRSQSFFVALFHIYLTASHLSRVINVIAHHLSRGNLHQAAFQATPDLAPKPIAILCTFCLPITFTSGTL